MVAKYKDIVWEFASRGLIHTSTDRLSLTERSKSDQLVAYVGFDPTADSLHVGHLLGQISLRRLQLLGHKPIVLAGGATGMVGDPSGRSEERNLLDSETLNHNVQSIKTQLEKILDFGTGRSQAKAVTNHALLVDNADWTRQLRVTRFLREVGKHVTVNQMMAKESVRGRLNDGNGLSFTEFSYMLLQANDFRQLCERHECELQMGGSDQWGNITIGIEHIRKSLNRNAYGLTWPLLTRSDGIKFGKTADGSVWLDSRRTSPYQFRQYWMQLSDEDVARLMPQFSFLLMDEVSEILSKQRDRPESRVAQRTLANELTKLLHGKKSADAAEQAADILFGANPSSVSRTAFEFVRSEVKKSKIGAEDGSDILNVIVKTGLANSKSEARRLLSQRGVRANGQLLSENSKIFDVEMLFGRFVLLCKGRTSFHLVEIVG